MSSDFYKLGATSAWQRYLVDPAKRLGTTLFSSARPPENAGALRTYGTMGADMAREMVFGSPINVYQDVKRLGTQGNKFSLGRGLKGLYRESFLPPGGPAKTWGQKAMMTGFRALPATMAGLQLYGAARNPENRGENIGGAVASLATMPLTARLGIPGMVLQAPITAAGRAVGRMFQRRPPAPAAQPDPMAAYYQALTRGAVRANTRYPYADTVPA